MDKLEKQIKKNKQKIRDRRGRGGAKVDTAPVGFDEVRAADDEAEIIVRTLEYKPMDAEEAVMQLDLADDNFIVFTNARTDRINVVYRRNDGHYGLIQPQ
jgi:putative sigma-54 modulation protein